MDEPLIRYKNVNINQQELGVLEDVNLELNKGEFVYLIGKVGSGKTSLLKTIYGELDIQSGDAEVLGYNMSNIKRKHIPQLRRRLGIVFQDFQLLTDRNVHSNLSFVLRATGWSNKIAIKERIDAIAVSAGMADQGVGKLIKDHRVKSLITTHIGLNPIAKDQMFAGELAIEFSPQGTFAERIRCGGAGLGGCLTPTGLGTEVEEGKQKLTINGKEYLLELPLRADVALIKATKADTAGNISFRMNSRATNSTMAMAADTVIVEVEEIVEVGELGPEEIDVPAPVIDMIYERTGEKRPMCPMWQRAKAKAEGGQ